MMDEPPSKGAVERAGPTNPWERVVPIVTQLIQLLIQLIDLLTK